ncbi:MAG: hypothetical protein ACJ785_00685 [Gemmatimonadaceae bacterium]
MGNSIEMTGDQTGRSAGATARPQGAERQGTTGQPGSQQQSLVDKAKTTTQERVRSAAMSGKTTAVETVSGLAQSLLVAGQQLQDQQSPVAGAVEQAAERLDRVAQYLDTAQIDDLVQRTESWARKNPALFLGGAFVLGVLGARFLKSSQPMMNQPTSGSDGSSAQFTDREVSRPPVMEGV